MVAELPCIIIIIIFIIIPQPVRRLRPGWLHLERASAPAGRVRCCKRWPSDVTSLPCRFSPVKSCCWARTTTRWQTSGPAVSQESDRSNKEDTEVQLYRALFSLRLESVLLNVVPWGTTYRSP